MDMGRRIRQARQRLQLTQQQLADRVGVDRRTVDNWENGRSKPKNRIGALEAILDIALHDDNGPEDMPPRDLIDESERRIWQLGADQGWPAEERWQLIYHRRSIRQAQSRHRDA